MRQIINRLAYDTDTATEVASDRFWDGSNWERGGRNQWLMKTKKGNFFAYHETCWQGERNSIRPLSKEEAMVMYEDLAEQDMDYAEAFGVEPEDA